jgi:hypothetical protein
LRAGRRFYGDPGLCDPPAHIGRPRRHGPKMKCNDPSTWGPSLPPSTSARTPVTGLCARAGVGRAASEGPEPRGAGQSGTPAHRGRHAHPGRGRAVAPRREPAGASGLVAMVARTGGDGAGSGSPLALVREALRPGAHLPLAQAGYGVDYPSGSSPRAGRSVEDVAGCGRLHAAKVGARPCCGPASAVGAPLHETGRLTPVRVHRVVSSLLVELGTPAKAPKPCGRSPGRPKGRLSGRAKRYPAIKKAA